MISSLFDFNGKSVRTVQLWPAMFFYITLLLISFKFPVYNYHLVVTTNVNSVSILILLDSSLLSDQMAITALQKFTVQTLILMQIRADHTSLGICCATDMADLYFMSRQ